jgi:hypothetical protein
MLMERDVLLTRVSALVSKSLTALVRELLTEVSVESVVLHL